MNKLKEMHIQGEFLDNLTKNFNQLQNCQIHQLKKEFIHLSKGEFLCYLCTYEKEIPPTDLILEKEFKKQLLEKIDAQMLKSDEYVQIQKNTTKILNEAEETQAKLKELVMSWKKRYHDLIEVAANKALEALDTQFAKESEFPRKCLNTFCSIDSFLENKGGANIEKLLEIFKIQTEISKNSLSSLYFNSNLYKECENHFENCKNNLVKFLEQTFIMFNRYFESIHLSFEIEPEPSILEYPGANNHGKIMMDPTNRDSKIFFKDCHSSKTQIIVYENIESLKNKSPLKTLELGTTVVGSYVCVFKNHLYACKQWDSSEIMKINLSDTSDKKSLVVEGMKNKVSIPDWGGNNQAIFCCDTSNLYFVFLKQEDSCFYLSEIDDKEFKIKSTEKLPTDLKQFSNLFIIDGIIYGYLGYNKIPNLITFKYDIRRKVQEKVNIKYANKGAYSVSLHYNHQTREMWNVDAGNKKFYRYKVNLN